MFTLARAVSRFYPPIYYNPLNGFAVELLEVGRIAEARNVCNIVLASPVAAAYPACRETSMDIDLRGRIKMGKEPNGDNQGGKANKGKTQDEMLYEIMNIFTDSDMDWGIRFEMLEAIQQLAAKQRAKKHEKDAATDKDRDEDKDVDQA